MDQRSGRGCGVGGNGDHVDVATAEHHFAVVQGEDREVAALTDAAAWLELRADLAHDDAAGGDGLAAIGFDATALRIRIATVLRRCFVVIFAQN